MKRLAVMRREEKYDPNQPEAYDTVIASSLIVAMLIVSVLVFVLGTMP
jgi:hypothetical protein